MNPDTGTMLTKPDMDEKKDLEQESLVIVSSYKKFLYHFDFPSVKESGYVELIPSKITLLFPDKHNLPENSKEIYSNSQNVTLFVNNQAKFSYQWLPIYTFQDFARMKDMLSKSYFEFLNLLQWTDYDPTDFTKHYTELITIHTGETYTLNCFENSYNTTIELDIKKIPAQVIQERPINFQIYIGSNLIFCLERDLKTLNNIEVYFVATFLLQKLLKL